jgi:hypothetical protein
MQDVVALIAYQSPELSPLAHLLQPSQRELVADAINAAILQAAASGSSSDGAAAGSSKPQVRRIHCATQPLKRFNASRILCYTALLCQASKQPPGRLQSKTSLSTACVLCYQYHGAALHVHWVALLLDRRVRWRRYCSSWWQLEMP